MSYSHNTVDEIQVKGLPLSNRKGCVVMILRCCATDQNKVIPSLFPQVPCPCSFPPQISSIKPSGFGKGVYKTPESFLTLPSSIAWTATWNPALKMDTSRLCQAAESSESCKSPWFIGFVQRSTGWGKPRDSPGIPCPSLSSHCSSAPTKGLGQASVRQQLWGSCPGTNKSSGGLCYLPAKADGSLSLSVPLCSVVVDGTQNKCPIPAQQEMTASRSLPQGVLLSLFSVCRQRKVITAFPSPQGDFTKHIFMPSLTCRFRDCLDEAASDLLETHSRAHLPLTA